MATKEEQALKVGNRGPGLVKSYISSSNKEQNPTKYRFCNRLPVVELDGGFGVHRQCYTL